jgi:hypothetical protein
VYVAGRDATSCDVGHFNEAVASGKAGVTAYETFVQWMISDAAALMAPDGTVTITLINVIGTAI